MAKKKLCGRPTNRSVDKHESVLLFLRIAKGISQRELAGELNMSAMEISRFENGWRGMPLSKVYKLATYFGVSRSALLWDDFAEVFSRMTHPIEPNQQQRQRNHQRQEARERIGYVGEDWVVEQERQKLAGTCYANAVNPNYGSEEHTGFDILSFDRDGNHIYIEVKATVGCADQPFYMSSGELRFLEECLYTGKNYQLHRVSYANDPERRERTIYSAREVLDYFERKPNSYLMRRKRGVVV